VSGSPPNEAQMRASSIGATRRRDGGAPAATGERRCGVKVALNPKPLNLKPVMASNNATMLGRRCCCWPYSRRESMSVCLRFCAPHAARVHRSHPRLSGPAVPMQSTAQLGSWASVAGVCVCVCGGGGGGSHAWVAADPWNVSTAKRVRGLAMEAAPRRDAGSMSHSSMCFWGMTTVSPRVCLRPTGAAELPADSCRTPQL
jgi:hypothetical protein